MRYLVVFLTKVKVA